MPKIDRADFPTRSAELLDAVQGSEHVIVTKDGKPFAMLIGLVNRDTEDLETMFDRSFWHMVQERRKESASIPFEEVGARLKARAEREQAEAAKSAPKNKKPNAA